MRLLGICLYFSNGSVLAHHYFEGGNVDAKSGDLVGDDVRRTGKIDLAAMNIPSECFNADGTLTLQKIRIYASGAANKKLYLYNLAFTTDRSPVGDTVIEQAVPLLSSDLKVTTPSQTGNYVYDNGTLTVTSESTSRYDVTMTLNSRVDITALKNLLMNITSDVPFDIQLLCTTAADDARYGFVSDFWPNLCAELDGGYIPAGNYISSQDLHSCFAWNNVMPIDGITTVKQVKVMLHGKGTLKLHALQLANTDNFGRFEDGQYHAANTPTATLESDVYTVTDTYIHSIPVGTTVAQLLSNMYGGMETLVRDGDSTASSQAVLKTGMTLRAIDDSAAWVLVVSGDVNRDGVLTTVDARMALSYALLAAAPDDLVPIAADFDHSGTVNTADARDILRATL